MNINEYISILVEDTSNELLKIYFNNHENRKTKLIFPENKNGDKRISEQEMRFTLLNIHEKNSSNLYYSVETPTTEDYGFSSDGKRRASSDLSFYNADVKVLNIELKAHNAEEDAINKDIEKLVSEDCNGAWIQLLKSENKGSVKRLFEKFEEAFKKYNHSLKPISFYILILETQTLLYRQGKEDDNYKAEPIFNIDFSIWKNLEAGKYYFNNSIRTDEKNDFDWEIIKFEIKK